MTEEARRVTIFGRMFINVSVEWLDTPIIFTIILGCLGLTISWSLNCAWETEVNTKLGLCKLNIDLVSEVEASLGVALSLSVPIMFPVVQ